MQVGRGRWRTKRTPRYRALRRKAGAGLRNILLNRYGPRLKFGAYKRGAKSRGYLRVRKHFAKKRRANISKAKWLARGKGLPKHLARQIYKFL